MLFDRPSSEPPRKTPGAQGARIMVRMKRDHERESAQIQGGKVKSRAPKERSLFARFMIARSSVECHSIRRRSIRSIVGRIARLDGRVAPCIGCRRARIFD